MGRKPVGNIGGSGAVSKAQKGGGTGAVVTRRSQVAGGSRLGRTSGGGARTGKGAAAAPSRRGARTHGLVGSATNFGGAPRLVTMGKPTTAPTDSGDDEEASMHSGHGIGSGNNGGLSVRHARGRSKESIGHDSSSSRLRGAGSATGGSRSEIRSRSGARQSRLASAMLGPGTAGATASVGGGGGSGEGHGHSRGASGTSKLGRVPTARRTAGGGTITGSGGTFANPAGRASPSKLLPGSATSNASSGRRAVGGTNPTRRPSFTKSRAGTSGSRLVPGSANISARRRGP